MRERERERAGTVLSKSERREERGEKGRERERGRDTFDCLLSLQVNPALVKLCL